jgi:hypothetical protein
MNLLALTSAELWLAVIVIVVVPLVFTAMFCERVHGAVTVRSDITDKKIGQSHDRMNELGRSGDDSLKSIEKTQLEINATVTEMLAVITNEAPHKAIAKTAREALADFNARSAAESIHKHEAYE